MPRNAHQRVEATPREPACRLPGALSHHFFARRRESGAEKSRSRCASAQTGRPSLEHCPTDCSFISKHCTGLVCLPVRVLSLASTSIDPFELARKMKALSFSAPLCIKARCQQRSEYEAQRKCEDEPIHSVVPTSVRIPESRKATKSSNRQPRKYATCDTSSTNNESYAHRVQSTRPRHSERNGGKVVTGVHPRVLWKVHPNSPSAYPRKRTAALC